MAFVRGSARTLARSSLLLLPLVGGGCAALKSRFPSHEDVFKPVPLTIGDLRLEGKDSVYVLGGRGYELVAPSREYLSDAQKSIDDVERAYERYFGAEPRPIVVRLRAVRRRDLERERDRERKAGRESAAPTRRPGMPRDSIGRRVVVIPVLAPEDRRPGGSAMPMSTFMFGGSAVAQAWLAAFADAYADTAAVAAAVAAAEGTATGTDGGRRPRRLPDWLAVGAVQMLSPRPYQEYSIGRLQDHQKELLPLRTLFDSARTSGPVGGPTAARMPDEDEDDRMRQGRGMDPGGPRDRRGGGFNSRDLDVFSTQSLAVVQFLAEREGPGFIGRLAERLVRGERPADAFIETRTLPHDLDAIDGQFRDWLEELGSRTRRVRG